MVGALAAGGWAYVPLIMTQVRMRANSSGGSLVDHDLAAPLCELKGVAAAQARPGAGDQRDATLKNERGAHGGEGRCQGDARTAGLAACGDHSQPFGASPS